MGLCVSRGLDDFRGGLFESDPAKREFDAHGFYKSLDAYCRPLRLECSQPFLVSWYNETRASTAGGSQPIEAPPAAVAFAIYSIPGFLETVAEHYGRVRPATGYVDAATDEILQRLQHQLNPELDALIVNTDEGPPYYHVQTVGAVANVDQHVEAEDFTGKEAEEWREDLSDRLDECRDTKMWGSDLEMRRKIFGVNVHPVWGGWYAYRALVVLRGALAESLPKPAPMNFLEPKEAQRIIGEYNLRHAECLWRDLTAEGHPAERRYTTDEFFFFTEVQPAKRRRWLEMRVAQNQEKPSSGGTPCLER